MHNTSFHDGGRAGIPTRLAVQTKDLMNRAGLVARDLRSEMCALGQTFDSFFQFPD